MMFKSNKLFLLILIFVLLNILKVSANLSNKEKKFIKDYKLTDDAFRALLDTTFATIKDPRVAFRAGEWKILKEDFDTIVVQHPTFPQYIVKVVPVAKNGWFNLFFNSRNIGRVIFLQDIKEYVQKHKLDFIMLPQKWIYEVPGTKIHAIVATKIDILPTPINKEKLKTFFTQQQKEEMYKFINSVVFWDGHSENMYITKEGKLAIIDTEKRISSSIIFIDSILKGLFRKRGRNSFYEALHT